MSGIFITFEGIDGCGKSTQIELLRPKLVAQGIAVMAIRDPGTTRISEQIRAILLNRDFQEMSAWTELLLYEAARAQMVEQIIKPALADQKIILCDRFYDSTTAYQGYGRQLDLGLVQSANQIGACGLEPNLTFLLDLEPELAFQRKHLGQRQNDRLENEDLTFYHRVRAGYLAIAAQNPDIIKVTDASQPIETIHDGIWQQINHYLF